ncbi:MAG: Glyoxylate reductase [Deltaproteobacteria bacterium]|jgi:phosphoglycerate dehydrogenase-like enzyme|nr:Glyoxylate reductase [Deltaproteobacteria bacterium]
MQDNQMKLSAPVVLADRVYMSEKALEEISRLGGYAWADAEGDRDLAEKIDGSPAVKVLVSEYVPINARVMDQAPGLKGIIAYGAGYDHVAVEEAARRGVQVCNCRGENAQAVAELTFALLLALMRRINLADPWVRDDGWPKAGRVLPDWAMGEELRGKTLGLVGVGQIGSRVARIANGFEMKVIAYDPFLKKLPAGLTAVPLATLLAQADILSFHTPLTAQTERMIDRNALQGMKPGAVIVNTSRGKIFDEVALVEAIETQQIKGAALDVFADEPIGWDHPLVKMKRVVLTPHIGALTREAGERLAAAVVRQARDLLEGRPPECLIK